VVFLDALRRCVVSAARRDLALARRTWRRVELGVDRPVDDPRLEASVGVTERYGGSHSGRHDGGADH